MTTSPETLYHFAISKNGEYRKKAHHIVLNHDCEVVGKHTRNIFTRAGNYTKAYLEFLAQYGLDNETVNQVRKTATCFASAREQIRIRQRQTQIDAWIEHPNTAPEGWLERNRALVKCRIERKENARTDSEGTPRNAE